MLEPNRSHWLRCALAASAFAASALLLGACAEQAIVPTSYLELQAAAARGATCDPGLQGELQLTGLRGPERLVVAGGELCAGAPLRRELTPGLYTLSWRSTAGADSPDPSAASPLRGPAVLSLLPGQVTRLRVQVESPVKSSLVAESVEEPTCAYAAGGSGAS